MKIEKISIGFDAEKLKAVKFFMPKDSPSLEVCHPSKNRHKKAPKNEMNRSISLIYANRPHLFHGLLDNEPLPV